MTTCKCGKPTRDDAYVCDSCTEDLSRALGDVAWLDDELETTITKRKGIDYRRVGGGSGGKREQPSPPEWTAADARDHLKAVLVAWVLFCSEERVRNSSPHQAIPEDTLLAVSRWLMWRVDGLALHDIGADAVDEITSAVAHCHRLIDRPADRQYLGQCQTCAIVGDDGRLYGRPGGALARCNICGDTIDAEQLRTKLLAELDDRLCTAAEVAHLATYLGLPDDRERIRKRVERWGASDRHPLQRVSVNGADHYRFGAAYFALMQHESRRHEKKSA